MLVRRAVHALTAAALVSFGTGLAPDAVDAQNLAQLYRMSPKPGQAVALESAIRAHSEWRQENGDPWSWDLWQVTQGEGTGDFVARSDGHAWADFDAYEASGFGARAQAHFWSTVGPLLASDIGWIEATDTAHRRLPENTDGIRVVVLYTYHLKPDMTQEFDEAVAQIHDAIVDADYAIHYAFHYPEVGGTSPAATLALLYEDYTGMEPPETSMMEIMEEAYGEEEAQAINESFAGTYTHVTSWMVVRRPDLSVTGAGGM